MHLDQQTNHRQFRKKQDNIQADAKQQFSWQPFSEECFPTLMLTDNENWLSLFPQISATTNLPHCFPRSMLTFFALGYGILAVFHIAVQNVSC